MTIRILLADDHPMVRRGLQSFLQTQPDLAVAGEASNGLETLEKVAELRPDVVLMDLVMPSLNGVEATKRIKENFPSVKVIVLTSFADEEHVLPAIRAGASGYLLKDVEPEELASAIRRVHEGRTALHPDAAERLMNGLAEEGKPPAPEPAASRLTSRERQVLELIAAGRSNKQIAAELFITEKTVKSHVSHLLDKLGMSDRTQAAVYAVKQGLGG